jgi:hypothetical protein
MCPSRGKILWRGGLRWAEDQPGTGNYCRFSVTQDVPRSGGALDGKLYVPGGANFDMLGAPPIGRVRVYDPGANAWTTKASMLRPRYYAAGINPGGLIWVIGARDGEFRGAAHALEREVQ